MNTTLILVVLAAYFVVMIGIGWYGRKYAKDFDSFASAGKSCGAISTSRSWIWMRPESTKSSYP